MSELVVIVNRIYRKVGKRFGKAEQLRDLQVGRMVQTRLRYHNDGR